MSQQQLTNQYRVLKIPINRERAVFYYYKAYNAKEFSDERDNLSKAGESSLSTALVDIEESKSVYICHFDRQIDPEFVKKFFGKVGKIKQINLGSYRNKANNKRKGKRRTIYYAIVVYKHEKDAQNLLGPNGAKLLQSIVNKVKKKSVKAYANGFGASDDELEDDSDEDAEVRKEREAMEDGGFTLVKEGAQTLESKRKRVGDGVHTTMLGITQEEAQRLLRENLKKGKQVIGMDEEEVEEHRNRIFKEDQESEALRGLNLQGFIQTGKSKMNIAKKQDLYAHQQREQRKQELEKLQADFEVYKRRLAKRIEKDKNRQKALMRS